MVKPHPHFPKLAIPCSFIMKCIFSAMHLLLSEINVLYLMNQGKTLVICQICFLMDHRSISKGISKFNLMQNEKQQTKQEHLQSADLCQGMS